MVSDALYSIAIGSAGSGITAGILAKSVKAGATVSAAASVGLLLVVGYETYREHERGQADVAEKSAAYEAARGAYEACANPPERYTYTDYNGYVYEFSDKASYNQFLRNRGLSTI